MPRLSPQSCPVPLTLPVTVPGLKALLLSAVSVSGLMAAPAVAQTSPLVQFLGTIVLDPAFARARDPEGTAADRGNSHYVADAELERARTGDLRDLFSGIASVSVGGAIPIAQKIFVNGIDMLNLAVVMDGVSQNNRLFHHISANAFDPGLLRFVRVDAGAAPADLGPHAMAGAVVMETVDPVDFLDPDARFGGDVRLSFDSNGQTWGRAATLAGRMGALEWLAYARRATGDDYRDGAGDLVAGSAAALDTGLVKLAFHGDNGHRFELSAQSMEDNALRPYRANIGSVGRPDPLRLYETRRRTFAFTYENTQASGYWDPRLTLGLSDVTVAVDQPFDPALSPSLGENRTYSGSFQNTFHLSPDDTIVAGIDYYDRRSQYSDRATRPIVESARNWGLFAQARLEPGQAWSLSFGARWDRQDFVGTNGWEESFSGLSSNLSVSYQATDALRLRGGISSVFGGVALEDNFIFNPGWDYTGMRASRADNVTLGFDWEQQSLRLDGEVFMTRLNDVRLSSYAANATGDAESRGFNLGMGFGWDNGFLRASYAYSQIRVNGAPTDSYSALDLGAPLGGVIALEAQHRPWGGDLVIGGSVEAALAYDGLGVDSDQSLPGYTVFNLFMEYEPPSIPGMVLRAEVNNVFDTRYADRSTYGGDYASVTPLYEPGRSFALTASMRF
ncbi:TonB-dependent receptor [Rhodobacter sp. NTK016B]|uniref:TonB-dependent receptor plug domain-containing protein n=1 Tax=Rhodobacter sp. NTK016B TaxID=2759676 RepID=UPI001A8EC0EB|nr:TonB-dependent receptor [Rhodobacter sp. NTK016B]MBN8294027.1 TonB-dependent receptor [Rhodobacter sp. NTK016B]